jgi:hypothetical protein
MKILLAIAAFFTTLPTLSFVWSAIDESRYPYEENGRFFDGMTVHHQDSVLGYGLAATAFLVITLVFLYFLRKLVLHDRKN